MARMNLRPRREAPGMSLFWVILMVGAGVFLLVAIFVYVSDGTQIEPAEPEIVAGEGDEPPGTSSFTEGEVAEDPAPPPELPGETGEVDESIPSTGEADDSAEAGTAGPVDADPAAPDNASSQPAANDEQPAGSAPAQ